VVPMFSAISATEPIAEAVVQSIMPTRSSVYEIGGVTVYYRFDSDNRLLIGGRSVQRDVTAPAALRYLAQYAERLWPVLRDINWTHG
jgi:glycine/D-amino acid oxidase-like deaminating enzyme